MWRVLATTDLQTAREIVKTFEKLGKLLWAAHMTSNILRL
jgi:hypothetical protein